MVVGALDVDRLGEAALELGEVIGDVGHEVGVGAVGLAHDAVLVVAVVGRAQPQRAAILVGLAGGDQARARSPRRGRSRTGSTRGSSCRSARRRPAGRGPARGAGRRRRTGGCRRGRRVARGGELAVVGVHRLAGEEVGGDVGDVVAVVGRLGPAGVAGLEAVEARLHRRRQRRDLHARVVVVELARARAGPASRAGCRSRRRARPGGRGRRAAARSGWPRRTRRSPARRSARRVPKRGAGREHLGDDACWRAAARRRRLMKPGPAIVDRLDPALDRGLRAQRGDQLGATSRGLRLSALASGIAAVTARSPCSACLGVSNAAGSAWPGLDFGNRRTQRVEQFFTGRDHRSEFYEAPFAEPPRVTRSQAGSVKKGGVRERAGVPRDRRGCKNAAATRPARCPSPQCPPPPRPKHRSRPRRCRRTSASTASSAVSATVRRARSSSATTTSSSAMSRSSGCARRPAATRPTATYSERFFAAEAALVGRLQHPNVVQIFDAVPDPVAPYLVMEYVPGSTLRALLPRRPAAARSS